MRKSMRDYRWMFIFFVLILVLGACTRPGQNGTDPIDPSGKTREPVESVFPPMIRVKGKLYKDTGYVDSCLKCGTADGKIVSSVAATKMPEKDNESNFGKGYSYQYSGDNRYILVKIDKKWHIFQSVDIEEQNMPDRVAHFTAEVKEVTEGHLLIDVVDVPEDFIWIFRGQKIGEIKPIRILVDDLEHYQDKIVTTEDLLHKKVEVWFDGSLNVTGPERSDPGELGEVYRIKILDE